LSVGGFYAAKDSSFIQEKPNLARIANIDLASDLEVRTTIWGMAWEGVKERPILGWGMGNFNYVFNEQYDPFLFNQEQWFDRAHNIVFDWLIAGGFLGFFAYFGIFAACLYYLVVVPLRNKDEQTFTVLERGVLLGILAGYLTHNLVVFDNLISYIFFAVILALIHARVGEPIKHLEKVKVDQVLFTQFLVPAGAIAVAVVIYFVNVPGMLAAQDIIEAYRVQNPADKLARFDQALSRESFAHQEITEQLSQQAMGMMRDPQATDEVRQQFIVRAEQELNKLVAEKPGDARAHVFFSSFYRSIGEPGKALEQIELAEALSPRKATIIMQRAILKYTEGDIEAARDTFKQAYDLDTRNDEALIYYAGTLFLTNEGAEAKALVTDERLMQLFAQNDFLVSAVNTAGDTAFLAELYEIRAQLNPTVPQNWASLSFIYYSRGEKEKAVDTLERAKSAAPNFSKSAQCFIDNINAGKEPQEGC
jgi:cytochrome c-type biogenesis protein CcmH/NrfG